MTELEARFNTLELIKKHSLHDEIWLGLTMLKVNQAIQKKTGNMRAQLPQNLNPEKIYAEQMKLVERIAEELIKQTGRYN